MEPTVEAFDMDLALALHNRDGEVPSFVDRSLPDFPLTIIDRDLILEGLEAVMEVADSEDSERILDLRRRLMTYSG